MMENREYLNQLFDIYGLLLTDIEQVTFKNYYQEDYSLSEIAENRKVSKSSVGKTLKQAEDKLVNLETNLHILKNNLVLQSLTKENDINKIKEEIINIIERK